MYCIAVLVHNLSISSALQQLICSVFSALSSHKLFPQKPAMKEETVWTHSRFPAWAARRLGCRSCWSCWSPSCCKHTCCSVSSGLPSEASVRLTASFTLTLHRHYWQAAQPITTHSTGMHWPMRFQDLTNTYSTSLWHVEKTPWSCYSRHWKTWTAGGQWGAEDWKFYILVKTLFFRCLFFCHQLH